MNSVDDKSVLILGGTGVFGKRLARHLARAGGFEILVTSRSEAKAKSLSKELLEQFPQTKIHGVALERDQNLIETLKALKPHVVVDCSGPFQTASYETARAVLASGSHLIDLADSRDYLKGFNSQLNDLAMKNKVAGLTGASSTPTLSACIAQHVTRGWQRVDSLDYCITPGGKSEVGQSVIEAILSYVGKKVPVWREGKADTTTGWSDVQRVHVPGLGARRVAAVETLDAELLGSKHNVYSHVTFSAGLESKLEQWGIEAIARLRKHKLFPDPMFLAPVLTWCRKLTRITTSDRGGMLLQAKGLDKDGKHVHHEWSLLAEQDHGPNVPILAAAALVKNLLKGEVTPGARLACDVLVLSDITAETLPYEMRVSENQRFTEESIYERKLGAETFDALPPSLKRFHSDAGEPVWSGKADIKSGKGILPKIIAKLFGFPSGGTEVPVTVTVDRKLDLKDQKSEHWIRNFAGKRFSSILKTRGDGRFTEQFGPFVFEIDLVTEGGKIKMPLSGWKLGPIPLPLFLAPQSTTVEYEDDQKRFNFDVRITLPVIGLLAHYKGWLEPQTTSVEI